VDGLIENARRMLEAATAADRAGRPVTTYAVYLTGQGGFQMVAGVEEPLAASRAARGARAAWRITRQGGNLCVEGEGEGARCRLETASANRAAACLLGAGRMYSC
jgi:hypothetical protein